MFEGYKYRYSRLLDTQIEEYLYADILTALHTRYGPNPDAAIWKRIEDEWNAIRRTDTVADVAFLHEYVSWAKKKHLPY